MRNTWKFKTLDLQRMYQVAFVFVVLNNYCYPSHIILKKIIKLLVFRILQSDNLVDGKFMIQTTTSVRRAASAMKSTVKLYG